MNRDDLWAAQRESMVREDLEARGIHDPRVLAAMRSVPRHLFVLEEYSLYAYSDRPLPTGEGQTISQPYMVALMTQSLQLQGDERVLEIGTGSGYQTAVLAEIVVGVWTVERAASLSDRARQTLDELGYTNVCFRVGDGTGGWASEAPFDRVIATGSLPDLPARLVEQLTPDGIFVGPVGSREDQDLLRLINQAGSPKRERLAACRFVPLVGRWGWDDTSTVRQGGP